MNIELAEAICKVSIIEAIEWLQALNAKTYNDNGVVMWEIAGYSFYQSFSDSNTLYFEY